MSTDDVIMSRHVTPCLNRSLPLLAPLRQRLFLMTAPAGFPYIVVMYFHRLRLLTQSFHTSKESRRKYDLAGKIIIQITDCKLILRLAHKYC